MECEGFERFGVKHFFSISVPGGTSNYIPRKCMCQNKKSHQIRLATLNYLSIDLRISLG